MSEVSLLTSTPKQVPALCTTSRAESAAPVDLDKATAPILDKATAPVSTGLGYSVGFRFVAALCALW